MENLKRKRDKNWLGITGSFIIILGISLIIYDKLKIKQLNNIEEKALETFYENELVNIDNSNSSEIKDINNENKKTNIPYIASIKIPKINLEQGLVSKNSYLNSVEYGIEIIKESSFPDEENSNLILASHSGNVRIAHFKKLYKLEVNDKIIIDYKNKTYTYKVVNIYYIEKTGKVKIIRNRNIKTLTLITCRKNNKQMVVIAEIESERK